MMKMTRKLLENNQNCENKYKICWKFKKGDQNTIKFYSKLFYCAYW